MDKKKVKLTVYEIALFPMLGALMFVTKKAMEFLPNMHLLGVFIIAITVVYRKRALWPIYIYVLLDGLSLMFSVAWIPYLYIWTVLWGATMLLPKKIPEKLPKKYKPLVYMCLCGLHGFLFGLLYAPAEAALFGLDFRGTVIWIIKGIPWDCVHGVSNFACGILILPLIKILQKTKPSGRGL